MVYETTKFCFNRLVVNYRNLLRRIQRKRSPLQFVYSDAYWMVDIGDHVFPMDKYRLIYQWLLRDGVKKDNILPPAPAVDEDILLVHTPKYYKKLRSGRLSTADLITLELPYSEKLLDYFRLTIGGSILSSRRALENGLAFHIGGGFHHAFADHGEGFCLLNDIAVAIEVLIRDGKARKVMVVDCDVHQGNGTAAVFEGRKDVLTFSIHQMDIYPAQKMKSTVDVGLWSGDGDGPYLFALKVHIPRLMMAYRPDIVFFIAGADPSARDQLGGLNLSFEGLIERDKTVLAGARALDIPTVVLLAGGYASDINDTVRVHVNTIQTAKKIHKLF